MSLVSCVNLLSRYLRRQRARVLFLVLLLLGTTGLHVVSPQVVRLFIDAATSGGAHRTLIGIAVLFSVVAVIDQLLRVAMAYVGSNVGWIATNQLRADLSLHCLNLDMTFHTAHTPGEMIERIDGDVNDLAAFFRFIIRVAGNLLLILGILIALFLEDWRVGVGLVLYVTVALAILSRIWPISVVHAAATREAEAQLSGFFEERLAGTEDIGANGGWRHVIRGMLQLSRERARRGRKAQIASGLVVGTANTLFAVSNAIGLALGAALYLQGVFTLGTAYLVFHYATQLFWPLRSITWQIGNLQNAGAGIHRIQALFQTQTSIREPAVSGGAGPWMTKAPTVRFRNVSFTYTAGEPVLHDLSFEVRSGQVLGLLGRTGSGKTSIARLLLRLYDPTGGTIRLNDVRIDRVPLADLRRQVGLVPQRVQIFRASVRDNLAFYSSRIDGEQVVRVLDGLGLSAWRQALPDGVDTQLDPDRLSAGEAQLLALGRIFLGDPGVVILDEASSRLDPATERRLEAALDTLLQGRTSVIIAHRLSTIQRADHVMILDGGRIIEYGERQSLMANPASCFSRLLQTGLDLTEAAEKVLP